MIRNDADLQATQERILLFERILAEARRTYSVSNYAAMAEGYWLVIDKLQADIRAYLSCVPDPIVTASSTSWCTSGNHTTIPSSGRP
jgi:hypothetical protein